MIIDNVKYIYSKDNSPASAAIAMLVNYYKEEVSEFYHEHFPYTFESNDFYHWLKRNYSIHDIQTDYLIFLCMEYLVSKHDKSLNPQITKTNVNKIIYTYIKRKIPVLLKLDDTILMVKGYTEKYLICNDPKGNRLTNYIDKHGENVIYSINYIRNIAKNDNVYLFTLRKDLSL